MKVDKSIVLTDEVVDGLLDDWFDRDGETFVHKRTEGRLGWEKELEKDESYSAYFLEAPTQEDLIKRAYSLARDMIVVMDPPFKVDIKITTGEGSMSATDGKVVYASTSMFDDKELSTGEKLDTFIGVVIHEGCHLLYTDLSLCREVDIPIIRQIWNVIEDERVERLCGDHKPGLANFLEKTKYYFFDQYYLDFVVPREKEAKLTPFERLFNLFLNIIRYPKYIKEDEVIAFGHYLIAIKKVLSPYPKTTDEAIRAAKDVYDIIKELYTEEERKKEEEKKKTESYSREVSDEEIEDTAERRMREDSSEAMSAIDKLISTPKSAPSMAGKSSGLSGFDLAKAVKEDSELLGEICEGTAEVGSKKDTFFLKTPDKQGVYMESYARIRRYIPAISKILKGHNADYKLIHRSMRSGVLDTNKLADAFQGVPTVYVREGKVKTDNVAVCVLIDESGSMDGKRIEAARDTAILINEALKNISNVELFIYGHSGDKKRAFSTELYVYREKGYAPKYALGSVEARWQNRDGVAIYEVAQRVRKQTENPVLFFILSDGAPCAGNYGGIEAMNHVREMVKKTEQLGMYVIQVCIYHSYDPSKMFKHFVIMDNMDQLPIELGRAIKKATLNNTKVRVL